MAMRLSSNNAILTNREEDNHLCLVGKNEKIVKNAHTTQVACKNPMQPV